MPNVVIKTLTGKKLNLQLEPHFTILHIKQMIQEREGIDVDQIKLIHSGKQVSDNDTVQSKHINENSLLHMVLQLR